MRQYIYSGVFLILGWGLHAQVGINTESPDATLDVNGNLAVKTMLNSNDNADKVVVRSSEKGILKTIDRSILGSGDLWKKYSPDVPATTLTDDMYHTGKIAIGKKGDTSKFYIYNETGTTNTYDFSFYSKIADGLGLDNTKQSSLRFISNLGDGSFTNLATKGDKALIFSNDGIGNANSIGRGPG